MTAMAAGATVVQRRPFQEVWVISLGHALTHWYPATFYLLLPLIGKELGLSYGQIGSILTCQFAAGAIANVPGGIFVDTVGRKGLLMAFALCWVGVPYLVMGFSHAYWMMLACATLVGIGNNIWHPTAIPWLADRFSERKGLVMAFHSMGGNIGDAVAPLVIGFLLQSYNWRTVVLMNVVPGIAVACFILVYIGRLQMAEVRAGLVKFKPAALSGAQRVRMLLALLSNKALVTLAIGSAFRSMNSRRVVDVPAALSGARYGIFSALDWRMHVCLAGCGLRGGPDRRTFIRYGWASADHHVEHVDDSHRDFVHDLCRRHRLVRVACRAPRILLFAVRAVLQAWLLDATPAGMGGSAIGMLFGAQAIGAALGPVSAGIVADHFGLMSAFYFLAGTIIVANLMIFITPAGLVEKPRSTA